MDPDHYFDPIATQRSKEAREEEENHMSRIQSRSTSKGVLKRVLRGKSRDRQNDHKSTMHLSSADLDLGASMDDLSNASIANSVRSKESTESVASLSSIISACSSIDALSTVQSASALSLPNSAFDQSQRLDNEDTFEDGVVTEGPSCAWNLMGEASMEVENRTNDVIMRIISSLDNDIITLSTGLLSRHLTFEPRHQATIWKANLSKLRDTLSELLEFSWRWRRWYRIVRSPHIQKVSCEVK